MVDTEINANDLEEVFDHIAEALADSGICILKDVVPGEITAALRQRVTTLAHEDFRRAGIGREQTHHLDDDYRTDEIHWLDESDPQEKGYLDWMELLRQGINRRLFVGLFDYEAHFAHYAPGAYYKRHLDAFKGNTNRVVTTVFYLNPDWDSQAGGEILMYQDEEAAKPFARVAPEYGTLVVFLSDRFPHEVVSATRDRYSIAGWFRVKSLGAKIDPPR